MALSGFSMYVMYNLDTQHWTKLDLAMNVGLYRKLNCMKKKMRSTTGSIYNGHREIMDLHERNSHLQTWKMLKFGFLMQCIRRTLMCANDASPEKKKRMGRGAKLI